MTSSMYLYVRARELEKTFSPDPKVGAWVVSTARILKGWGVPNESDWPYDGDAAHWPPKEPEGIDRIAKQNRILAYQRARTVNDCKIVMASRFPVVAALSITEDWFSARKGNIQITTQSIIGSHAVLLTGYDDSKQHFMFKNSWGVNWGDEGFGTIPYSYFDNYQLEAWTCCTPRIDSPKKPLGSIAIIRWSVNDILGTLLHCGEILDPAEDELIAWVFIVKRDGYADIEELFVRPTYRGKGYGSILASMANEIAKELNLSIRLWFPHADTLTISNPVLERILQLLNVKLIPCPYNWAAFLGHQIE